MPKAREERYMDWLERTEEEVGIDGTIRASEDIEEARRILYDQLGYQPTDFQLDTFMAAGREKYEMLPQIGVSTSSVTQWWGEQRLYRDLVTGRFVSREDVSAALAFLK